MNDKYDLDLESHINEPQLLLALYGDHINNYYESLVEEDDNEDMLIREMFDSLIVQ